MVTNWTSLGSPPGVQWGARPSVARNADGRLEVFLTAPTSGIPDIVLWHISQVTSGGVGAIGPLLTRRPI